MQRAAKVLFPAVRERAEAGAQARVGGAPESLAPRVDVEFAIDE